MIRPGTRALARPESVLAKHNGLKAVYVFKRLKPEERAEFSTSEWVWYREDGGFIPRSGAWWGVTKDNPTSDGLFIPIEQSNPYLVAVLDKVQINEY